MHRAIAVTPRIAVTRVDMDRAEGPTHLCGPRSFTRWTDAAVKAREWSETAPKGGGYDKVDVTMTWADGTSYSFRFDMVFRCEDGNTLGETLRRGVRFYSGRHCPSHMTEDRYRRYLAEFVHAGWQEQCGRMLDGQYEGINA